MAMHNKFGIHGESLACELLELKGYEILATNFRFHRAEIDIIAAKGTTLAVVEVKSRSSTTFGKPQDFVGDAKIRMMKSAVNAFVEQKKLDCEIRFDIVSVVKNGARYKVEHLPDAFYYF